MRSARVPRGRYIDAFALIKHTKDKTEEPARMLMVAYASDGTPSIFGNGFSEQELTLEFQRLADTMAARH